jgi:transposase InsO family protein
VGQHRPRLNVFARQLLVSRVIDQGKPVATVAIELGISRATGYKWLRRYRTEGPPGLLDRNSRPAHSPRRLGADREAAILAARAELHYGPHRLAPLLGIPRSTVYRVLRRRGFARLADADRSTGAPLRYEACHPGALLHQDHKKLGRVPDGGGWRMHGRGKDGHFGHSGVGYDHLEVFIDDRSRLGYVALVPDEGPVSAADALDRAAQFYARHGIRIERVLTDNGGSYRSGRYRAEIEGLAVRHKRTRPYRPQTNGKAERLIKTLLAEWAYARPYRTNEERLEALPTFVDFYNHGRPHTALRGRTPAAVVNDVRGNHS